MTTPSIRRANPGDCAALVRLMEAFYAESATPMKRAEAERAFAKLLDDPTLGCVWIAERSGEVIAYVVLTLGYSMEYGGRDAFVDDLFVRADARSRGTGAALLDAAIRECEALGVRALHLEVDRANDVAKALYRSRGFLDHERQLLTLRVASRGPTAA